MKNGTTEHGRHGKTRNRQYVPVSVDLWAERRVLISEAFPFGDTLNCVDDKGSGGSPVFGDGVRGCELLPDGFELFRGSAIDGG